MRVGGAVFGLVVACSDGEPPVSPHPCASDETSLEVAPPDGEYGDLARGGAFAAGIPPQGGAPYSPLRLRVTGPGELFDGIDVDIAVFEDGALLTETQLPMRLTCANVGDNAGRWVGAEVHLRYFGLELEELDGRDVTVEVTVTAQTAPDLVLTDAGDVTLVVD
ncbi:MAG: hypothetical protein AAGA48_04845 [Myxococcota bacterium]